MSNPLMRLKLRPATEADLSLITHWLAENQLPTEDISQILSHLYLAQVDDAVVGIGGIERDRDDGLLRSVVVAQSFRDQGYGQQLCRQLIQIAQGEGIQALYLLTNTADGFFTQLGFERIDRQSAPTTMQNTAEFSHFCPDSAVCMRLRLTSR